MVNLLPIYAGLNPKVEIVSTSIFNYYIKFSLMRKIITKITQT